MKKCMTTIFVGIFLLGGLVPFVSAEEMTIDSAITQVTVYPGAALIKRTADVSLKTGEHMVIFDNIIPSFDENSIMVAGQGPAKVKIFGANLKVNYRKDPTNVRVQELEKKIEAIVDQITKENNKELVLTQEREYLNSIKLFSGEQLPKDLVTKMPSAADLDGILGFISTKSQLIEQQAQDIQIRIRELNREKDALDAELNQIRSSENKSYRSIAVDLGCEKEGKFTLDISYLVYGVNWRPLYDARAQFDKSEVEMTSFGMLQQRTGEDWNDVELSLSTAKPTVGGNMPYVDSWLLRPYQPPRPMARGGMQNIAMKVAHQYEAFKEEDVTLEMGKPDAMSAPAEIAYSDIQQKGVSVNYKIQRKVTIKSDGVEHKVPISVQTFKANFEYSSYPRMSPFAYLGSRVVNSQELQLLAGQVNLFLEGDFVGRSTIDNVGTGEEFDLYLGIDENVKVEKKEVEKKVDDVLIGGIPSPTKKTTYKYKLMVQNNKGKKIRVKLFEAMPTSQDEKIHVKILEVNVQPTQKDWKDRKGVWLWDLELEAKQKKEIFYTFVVDHPRDLRIEGL